MKALFVPLKTKWYEAFESGMKCAEYRPYGPRWNEKTCIVGRPVILSKGYGKKHRLRGVITSFQVVSDLICKTETWREIYGNRSPAACIGIELVKMPVAQRQAVKK